MSCKLDAETLAGPRLLIFKRILKPQLSSCWEVEQVGKHRKGLSPSGTDPSRIIWSAQSSAQVNKSWRETGLINNEWPGASQVGCVLPRSQTWNVCTYQPIWTQLGSAEHLGDLRSLGWVGVVWASGSRDVLLPNHQKFQELPAWLFSGHRQHYRSQPCFFSSVSSSKLSTFFVLSSKKLQEQRLAGLRGLMRKGTQKGSTCNWGSRIQPVQRSWEGKGLLSPFSLSSSALQGKSNFINGWSFSMPKKNEGKLLKSQDQACTRHHGKSSRACIPSSNAKTFTLSRTEVVWALRAGKRAHTSLQCYA